MGINHLLQPLKQSLWSQCLEGQRHSTVSSTRWHMGMIRNWWTCCTRKMPISPMRIGTQVLTSQKTDGLSSLFHMIPGHPEHNHQATANSHNVQGVLGFLGSPISTRLKTVWAGKLWWKWELDSNFKSQLRLDCIHSMTGVIRQCGSFQVRQQITRMIEW